MLQAPGDHGVFVPVALMDRNRVDHVAVTQVDLADQGAHTVGDQKAFRALGQRQRVEDLAPVDLTLDFTQQSNFMDQVL